jgi:hypothetical protein
MPTDLRVASERKRKPAQAQAQTEVAILLVFVIITLAMLVLLVADQSFSKATIELTGRLALTSNLTKGIAAHAICPWLFGLGVPFDWDPIRAEHGWPGWTLGIVADDRQSLAIGLSATRIEACRRLVSWFHRPACPCATEYYRAGFAGQNRRDGHLIDKPIQATKTRASATIAPRFGAVAVEASRISRSAVSQSCSASPSR